MLASRPSEIGVGTALVVLIAIGSFVAPNFLTLGNFETVLRNTSVVAIVSIGMTFVIITGEIDLSVGAMVGLAGVVFSTLVVNYGLPLILAYVIVLLMAMAVGSFTGLLRVIWDIPSFITTIGLLSVLRGFAFLISDGVSIGPLPPEFAWFWYGDVLGLPTPIMLSAVIALIGWVVLSQTRFGQHTYALGGNVVTASRYGVKVNLLRVLVFAILEALAATGGVLLCARLNAGTANNGQFLELDVIAAVIVGGTSLNGGTGSIVGTLIGVLFVAVLRNTMVIAGVGPIVFMIAQGAVIIAAVWWSMVRRGASRRELAG